MAKLEPPSRMLLTSTREDDAVSPGTHRFTLWTPPEIDMEGYTLCVVTASDLGRLDQIAYRLLGDARLWWAIAYANQIANPLEDLQVGQTLKVPRREAVMAALAQQEVL